MTSRPAVTLIELLVCISVVGILVGLSVVSIQRVRSAASRTQCENQLRQIALSHCQFHDTNKTLPKGTGSDRDPYPFLNWHARLLPHLEQNAIWTTIESNFKLDRDFLNSPPHQTRRIGIPVFVCPAGGRARGDYDHSPGLTYYLGVSGTNTPRRNGLLFVDSRIRFSDITDGTSNTIMVGERPPSPGGGYGWWYAGWGQNKDGALDAVLGVTELNSPMQFRVDPGDEACASGPFSFVAGRRNDHCDIFHFWSEHSGGAFFAFADGTVRFLTYDAVRILPGLATRSGNDPVELP